MKLKNNKCPKCQSKDTYKEKILGADTLDVVCSKCGYTGHWKEFDELEDNSNSSI